MAERTLYKTMDPFLKMWLIVDSEHPKDRLSFYNREDIALVLGKTLEEIPVKGWDEQ